MQATGVAGQTLSRCLLALPGGTFDSKLGLLVAGIATPRSHLLGFRHSIQHSLKIQDTRVYRQVFLPFVSGAPKQQQPIYICTTYLPIPYQSNIQQYNTLTYSLLIVNIYIPYIF